MKHNYWNFFYKNKNINNKLNFPSQFSIFTLSKDVEKNILIELGCGNGRDACYMAKYYNKIIAIDSSKIAIKDNIKEFKNIKKMVKIFKKENFINIYSNSSYGYALFGNEDPHIARQIFIKK